MADAAMIPDYQPGVNWKVDWADEDDTDTEAADKKTNYSLLSN